MASPRNPYTNLVFDKGVDWQHVDPALLQKLNSTAKSYGQTVEIFSGYRSPTHNEAVGGAPMSLHTQGRAVDAYIGGQPIGQVWPVSVFNKLGLRTGNVANFFKGKPDPEHVDMGFNGQAPSNPNPVNTGGDTTSTDTSTAPPPATPYDPSQLQGQIQSDIASAPYTPVINTPVLAAQDMSSEGPFPAAQPPRYDTWQALSQLPGASPDTMKMTQLASYEAPPVGEPSP